MNRGAKILAIVGVIAGIMIIGAVVGWWGSRTPKPPGGGEPVVPRSNPPPMAKVEPTISTNKPPRKLEADDFHSNILRSVGRCREPQNSSRS